MPQADPASVRVAAAQASAVSSELQRIKSQLTGAAAGGGWTGTAQLAFDAQMADRIKQFDPVIARYDGYAASLISYARALEQTFPPLQQAHRRLLTASSNRRSSPDGTDPPEDLNQEFERLWRDWDRLRRVCTSALERAARNAGDRHGLSALWHSATHLGHEVISHVNLAEISTALSELGDVLFVAALVLSPVPGVGEALWAAVTIIAVAKLAVDGARMASGDSSVSSGDLAWDALGAMPGGKSAKAAKDALKSSKFAKDAKDAKQAITEAERATDGPEAAEAAQSKTVPGGLMAHEAAGGHVNERHIGKTDEYLAQRFVDNPKLTMSSTFIDRETAERVLSKMLDDKAPEIRTWLSGQGGRREFDVFTKSVVGRTMDKVTLTTTDVTNFHASLWRDPKLPWGFCIHTSFPMP